jgi:ABC-type branched-subunit amino acid transport system permease subunit
MIGNFSIMATPGKRIVMGAMIAASGAYAWSLLTFEFSEIGAGESRLLFSIWTAPLVAAYAVLITSWFVLPIGGLLGVLMPSVIKSCSGQTAFSRGAFLGICVGLIAALLTTIFMQWPEISGSATIVNHQAYFKSVFHRFTGYLLTMIPICALWVGIWAWRWNRNLVST